MTVDPERLYSLAEAAAEIHHSVKTAALRAAIDAGNLVGRKIGRTMLVAGRDLIDYLDRCRTCHASPRDQGSASTGQTKGTGRSRAKDSANTAGTSSGKTTAKGANERRALTIAQQLKTGKGCSPTSSTPRSAEDSRTGRVVPIR